jgi:tRNA-dihydrouridine synthase
MALSAKIVDAVNPDLVDINFGCPVKKVVRNEQVLLF